jgi:hypothetical protein
LILENNQIQHLKQKELLGFFQPKNQKETLNLTKLHWFNSLIKRNERRHEETF